MVASAVAVAALVFVLPKNCYRSYPHASTHVVFFAAAVVVVVVIAVAA